MYVTLLLRNDGRQKTHNFDGKLLDTVRPADREKLDDSITWRFVDSGSVCGLLVYEQPTFRRSAQHRVGEGWGGEKQ